MWYLQWETPELDLTFRKAFELCQASKLAEKNAQELQAGQKQSQKVAGASILALYPGSSGGKQQPLGHQPACYRCNSTQHLAKDCHFRLAGCITAENGPKSFMVELSDGRVLKRHLDHVRSSSVGHPPVDSNGDGIRILLTSSAALNSSIT